MLWRRVEQWRMRVSLRDGSRNYLCAGKWRQPECKTQSEQGRRLLRSSRGTHELAEKLHRVRRARSPAEPFFNFAVRAIPFAQPAPQQLAAFPSEPASFRLPAAPAARTNEAASLQRLDAADHGRLVRIKRVSQRGHRVFRLTRKRGQQTKLRRGEPRLRKMGVIVSRQRARSLARPIPDAMAREKLN
jgi:hypothetical protein